MPDRNLYKQKIIDHYKNPRNFGEMEDFDLHAHVANTVCGDELTVYLKVEDGVVREVSFKGTGCAISLAAMSMLSEKLVGMKVNDAGEIDKQVVLDLLGMDEKTPRLKCAVLGIEAVKRAIEEGEDDPCDFC